LRRFAVHVLLALVVAFAGLLAGTAAAEGDGAAAVLIGLAVVMGVAAAAPMVRQYLRNRELVAELLAWEAAERAGRGLPGGDVPAELRMPYDARDHADFEQVAAAVGHAAYTRPRSNRLLIRSAVAGLGIAFGLALVLSVITDVDAGFRWGAAIGGAYVLVVSLVVASAATRLMFRMTALSSAAEADIREFRAQREGVPEARAIEQAERRRSLVVLLPVLAVLVLLLVVRVSMASEAAVVATILILVVAAVIGGAAALRRRRDAVDRL
jgi:hypothetical protein